MRSIAWRRAPSLPFGRIAGEDHAEQQPGRLPSARGARLARFDDHRSEPLTPAQVVDSVHPSMLSGVPLKRPRPLVGASGATHPVRP